jgi:transposase
MQAPRFQLVCQGMGGLPILDAVIQRLGLWDDLAGAMGQDRYAEAILLLLKNIVVERNALYAIREWAAPYDPALVYGGRYGDDVLARALDRLFETDRASLLTRLVLHAVKAYGVDLGEIHQDTTSVKLTGAYAKQRPRAVQLVRGYSKDHRPDLRQLVYELSVTHDGAVPVLFKAHDGNRTDDTLHWENWQMLRGILGRADFLYVADSKLCVSRTLLNIDRNQGRFVTILPRTRSETEEFRHRIEASSVRWEKVWANRSSRQSKRLDLYEVASGLYQMREGFRLYWFRSSEKARRDWNEREDKIAAAVNRLRALADPANGNKPKTESALRRKVEHAVAGCETWIRTDISLTEVERFRQLTRGRSSAQTTYRKTMHRAPTLSYTRNEIAISQSAVMDGTFPLVTNAGLDALAVWRAYKYQPKLEKRHALLKSGLAVAPIFLKKNQRIEALMFVYFLAQLVCALIERQLRKTMRERGVPTLQILPEERPSASPTTEQVMRIFASCARNLLLSEHGAIVQTFPPSLTPIQMQILNLLSISPRVYT